MKSTAMKICFDEDTGRVIEPSHTAFHWLLGNSEIGESKYMLACFLR